MNINILYSCDVSIGSIPQQPAHDNHALRIQQFPIQPVNTPATSIVGPAFLEMKNRNVRWSHAAKQEGRSIVKEEDLARFLNPCQEMEALAKFIRPLGAGVYGSVSLWSYGDRQFAIKQFHKSNVCLQEMAANEFAVGLSLDHPNVVRHHHLVAKFSRGEWVYYLIMQYVDGVNLRITADDHTLDRPKLKEHAEQALQYIASRKVSPADLHRDNLMITQGEALMFIDFGAWKIGPAGEDENHNLLASVQKLLNLSRKK